jgi:hypothetical protein
MLLAQINNLSLHLTAFFTSQTRQIKARARQSQGSASLGGAAQTLFDHLLHRPSPAGRAHHFFAFTSLGVFD